MSTSAPGAGGDATVGDGGVLGLLCYRVKGVTREASAVPSQGVALTQLPAPAPWESYGAALNLHAPCARLFPRGELQTAPLSERLLVGTVRCQ